eukprot:PhF_6_TR41978/c0_g1_i1/m.63492
MWKYGSPFILSPPTYNKSTWEPDSSVPACPICGVMFMFPVKRRHHCRRCGRVVCDSCSHGTHIRKSCSWCKDMGIRAPWDYNSPLTTSGGSNGPADGTLSVLSDALSPPSCNSFMNGGGGGGLPTSSIISSPQQSPLQRIRHLLGDETEKGKYQQYPPPPLIPTMPSWKGGVGSTSNKKRISDSAPLSATRRALFEEDDDACDVNNGDGLRGFIYDADVVGWSSYTHSPKVGCGTHA